MEEIIKQGKAFFKSQVGITLIAGVVLSMLLPAILTQLDWGIDFTETGQIGDTIGGITTPILTITGLIIVYFSFQQQLHANNKQWKAFKREFNKSRQEEQFTDITTAVKTLSEDVKIHEPTLRAIAELITKIDSWHAELLINEFSSESVAHNWGDVYLKTEDDLWGMFDKFEWFANYYEAEWRGILDNIKESSLTDARKALLQRVLRNKCILPTYEWLPEDTLKTLWDIDEIRFQNARIATVINEIRVGTPNIFPLVIQPIRKLRV